MWFKEVDSEDWVGGVMYAIWRMFAFIGLSQYFDRVSCAFFSCTLPVIIIGLFFFWQCFLRLPSSTETSISGTSPLSPIWVIVSQCVYWRMSCSDAILCYCDWRVQSRVWESGGAEACGRLSVLSWPIVKSMWFATNCDILKMSWWDVMLFWLPNVLFDGVM